MNNRNSDVQGSITVFLTIIFMLLFSLFGVTFENARLLSSYGYMRVAAHSAAMTVFGDFNRELYEEYGLFGYGGYDAVDQEGLNDAFRETLIQNTTVSPKNKSGYINFYRLKQIDSSIENSRVVSDDDYFYEQIGAYVKTEVIEDLSEIVREKMGNTEKDSTSEEKLRMAQEYEEGKYDASDEEEQTEISSPAAEDEAGGNPLKALSELVNSGVLALVCDEKKVEEQVVESWDETEQKEEYEDGEDERSASAFLKDILLQGDDFTVSVESGAEKIALIQYGVKQFGSYTENKNKTVHYGREYLISGNCSQKSALASVVKKLLAIRMLVNFVYVVSDAALQQKSLATATAIAGITGLTPVIKAVQYVILMILAFWEACIDVTALLEGRYVPVYKNADNFLMKYAEICMGTRSLFQKKAKVYAKETSKRTFISYEEYLWLFTLITAKEKLCERTKDLIQYDLRQRFNQTFLLNKCVGSGKFVVWYKQESIFSSLPFISEGEMQQGIRQRCVEVEYEYKSE